MRESGPSRTALRVAVRRAAHQLFDAPLVLDDPVALRIIGEDAASRLTTRANEHRGRIARALRAFMVVRSRLAEDELARAISRGAAQYVILGAGLDTFAYRNPYANVTLRVFEVDHPATQEWKRRLLAAAAIAIPSTLTYAPVDFEQHTLADGLAQVRFDPQIPTFFSWLGVTMYLTQDAVDATLRFAASTPRGGGIVFDYGVATSRLGWTGRLALGALSRRVAAAGEPFQTLFDPPEIRRRLSSFGCHSIADLGADELNARYFRNRSDGLRVSGSVGRLIAAEL
jgi:methyltransferase (TIGR00027 family)